MFRGNREVYGGGTTFGSSSTVFKSSISGHSLSNLWCAAHRFCFLGVDIKNAGPTGLPRKWEALEIWNQHSEQGIGRTGDGWSGEAVGKVKQTKGD